MQQDNEHSPPLDTPPVLQTTLLLILVCIFAVFAVRFQEGPPAPSAIAYPIHAPLD
jgi:hypothetical protein